jgi:PAS domain S-box-containing protein
MSTDDRSPGLFPDTSLLDAVPYAAIGTDIDGLVRAWNPGAERLYGWTKDEAIGRQIADLTPTPEHLANAAIMAAVRAGESWSGEFPVRRKDGSSFLSRTTLSPLLDAGEVIGMLGISEDVSELRFHEAQHSETGERLRLALDASGLGAWEWDVGTGRVHWDARMEEIFGFDPGTFPGTYDAWLATVHPDDLAHVLSSVQHAVALKSRNTLEHRIVRQDGQLRWIESHSQSVVGEDGSLRGTIGCVRDITALKNADQDRQRLRRQEQFLFDAGDRLSESLEVEQTLTIVADVCVPVVADWCVLHLLDERGLRLGLLRHRHAQGQLILSRVLNRWPAILESDDEGVGATVRDGKARLFPVIPATVLDEAAAAGDERAAALRDLDLRSVIVVPLQARGRVVGAVTFGRDRTEPFDAEQQTVLSQLATRAALAIDNAVTYERERRAALTLQHSLLPEISITVPGFSIATRYFAGAEGAQVGGDWYDAITLPDGRIGVTVGDVMGHGLASAALMGQVRAALRGIAATGSNPAEVLRLLDGVVQSLSETQLVTCAYGVYDPQTSTLTFASAGHPPPMIVKPNATPRYLDVEPGAPLGVSVGDLGYPLVTETLSRGATVVLFSDGLVESRQRPLAIGLETLRAMAARPEEDLERLCDRLVAGMHAGITTDDDTALLVLRVD